MVCGLGTHPFLRPCAVPGCSDQHKCLEFHVGECNSNFERRVCITRLDTAECTKEASEPIEHACTGDYYKHDFRNKVAPWAFGNTLCYDHDGMPAVEYAGDGMPNVLDLNAPLAGFCAFDLTRSGITRHPRVNLARHLAG